MKKYYLMTIAAMLPLISFAQKTTTIQNPEVGGKTIYSQGIFVEKVERSDKETKIHFKTYHGWEDGRMQISGESYITANGENYQYTGHEGIPLNEWFKCNGENFTREFSLTFPAIDKNVDMVDYIECSGPTCFRIFDIPLTKEASDRNKAKHEKANKEFEKAIKVTDDGKTLPTNKLMIGTSKLKGSFVGYRPEIFGDKKIQVMCYINNPITYSQDNVFANIDEQGKFEMDIPLTSQYETVGIQTKDAAFVNQTFLATINGTEEIIIDLNRMMSAQNGNFCYYKGDNADINTAINMLGRDEICIDYTEVMKFTGSTAIDFKKHIYDLAKKTEQNIENSNMPKKAKEYAKIDLRGNEAYYLGMAQYFMEQIYREANGLNPQSPIPNYKSPEFTNEYTKYAQELNLNSIEMLYSSEYFSAINNFRYVTRNNGTSQMDMQREVVKQMIDEGNTDEVVKNMYNLTTEIATSAGNKPLSESDISLINKFNEKYRLEFSKKLLQLNDKKTLEVIGSDKGIMVECLKSSPLFESLASRRLIDAESMETIEQIGNPVITEYAKHRNAQLKAEIDAENARGGYYQHQTNETEADAILVDILKIHQGKVAFVDMWATWCGPCRMGIAAMKHHHEELSAKGVDFIYITDESSPTEDYNAMIAGMQGDHYRLTNDQMSKLKEKFHVTGIPHYLFINKKGEVAETQSGWSGEQRVIDVLEKLLNE